MPKPKAAMARMKQPKGTARTPVKEKDQTTLTQAVRKAGRPAAKVLGAAVNRAANTQKAAAAAAKKKGTKVRARG